MRLPLTIIAFVVLSSGVFGQEATPSPQSAPAPPVAPGSILFDQGWDNALKLMAPGETPKPLPWKLLPPGSTVASMGAIKLYRELTASTWEAPGHCSIPLIEVPLPQRYDEGMVRKLGPHPDDKMAMATPPVCPLRSESAGRPKRK